MASLAEIKTQSGKAGGELQQEDVRRLRKEVEIKMEKLNEIRKVSGALLSSDHSPSRDKHVWSVSNKCYSTLV